MSIEVRRCTTYGVNYSSIPRAEIPLLCAYNIIRQLEAILAQSQDLVLKNKVALKNKGMKDITDGNMYRKLVESKLKSFITLTFNVDGIQSSKGSNQSLWPILLVINEINRKKRYSRENSMIAGTWPGSAELSRTQMSLFFKNIVLELQDLEQCHQFQLFSANNNDNCQITKVLLVAACCDKLVQCLL